MYPQARALLASLLKESPYESQYLAAMADSYAKGGDQQGLKQFYVEEIAAIQSAPLSTDAKKSQLAAMRRGLIPALTGLGDFSGAVDQYMEILNAFPGDEGLANEAALYAARHRLESRLVEFYAKTVQQSPRDDRWAAVLARIHTALEDYPAAIAAYGKAIAIRPERVDLRTARGGLCERLMRWDDAITDYAKLYELSYKDPQWMGKIAEIRARQGRTADAVAALKVALIEGKPERPGNYFEAARRLEAWSMLPEARSFAEMGVHAGGADLLASAENHAGAALYARVMTRLRQQDAAYAQLQLALSAASAAFPVLVQQAAREGIAAVTDSEWRKRTLEARVEAARTGMRIALQEMGRTVAGYFTPEERGGFALFAHHLCAPMNPADMEAFAVPLADAAGLEELGAKWRYELAMDPEAEVPVLSQRIESYAQVQRSRLRFAELAPQLEQFAPRLPPVSQPAMLIQASKAYRSAGDSANELRVLSSISTAHLSGDVLQRYFELLLELNPQGLVQTAANWTPWGEHAAQYAIANGGPEMAHQVVAARARPHPPVWKNSYDALTGLYFAENTPAVNRSFLDILGDQTIGERIGKQVNRQQQLAGDIWFYYGSRYGEYLGAFKQPSPEDFLAAVVEQSPASPQGYLQLADYYAGSGDARAAIADYFHVLELQPSSVEALLRLARAYYQQGDRAAAVQEWKLALAQLTKEVSRVVVPESFWTDFGSVTQDSASHRLFAEIKPEVDALLRAYLKKNGSYRSNELLKSACTATGDPAAAVAWLVDLSSASAASITVLVDVADAPWIPPSNRAPIYERVAAGKQEQAEKAAGTEKEYALAAWREWQLSWVRYLVRAKRFQQADALLSSLPEEVRTEYAARWIPLELQVAARLGTLDAKLAAYRVDEEKAPAAEMLRTAARELQRAGDRASARKILEFVFAREIDRRNLVASTFLGLAEIRIAAGDLPGAMQLLRRLTVVVGNPFENLDPAAALLEKTGHATEAVEFLAQLSAAAPWDASVRLRWARARIAANADAAAREEVIKTASSPLVSYGLRVEAAQALAGQRPGATLGSEELNLLAGAPAQITTIAADKPYFYDARLRAGKGSTDPQAIIQLLRKAVEEFPQRDPAKYPLFETAAGAHADALALAVLERTSVPSLLTRAPMAAGDEDTSEQPKEGQSEEQPPEAPAQRKINLSRASQARICAEAAEVLERTGRLKDSLSYLQAARRLEPVAQRRAAFKPRIAAVKKELERRTQNAARQPVLHQALEQNRLVRPRLLPTAAPAAEKGVTRP